MTEETKQNPTAATAPVLPAEENKTAAETVPEAQTVEAKAKIMPELRPGMTVRVHQKIKETNTKGEEKERIQIYEGIIIAMKHGKEQGGTITVQKISDGVGVEKIFPIYSPNVAQIVPVKQAQVRRAKLHHLRTSVKRLKEKLL